MITLPDIFSEFLGRRVLRLFTSYDRTKFGIEFEQLSTNPRYRYLFDIEGTIDRIQFITDLLGHKPWAITSPANEYDTGQNKLAFYCEGPEQLVTVLSFSPAEGESVVTLTYTAEDRKKAPYGSVEQYIVQEDDFDYGPVYIVPPPIETYYILAETGDYITSELGDRLLQEDAA